MDPVTLAMLAAGVGSGTKALAEIIPTDLEKKQKMEAELLGQKVAAGSHGMTEAEKQLAGYKISGPVEQAARQAEENRSRLLAGGAVTSGQQAQLLAQAEEGRMDRQRQLEMEILGMDMLEKEKDEAKLAGLEAVVAEDQKRNRMAVADVVAQTAEAGFVGSQQERFMDEYAGLVQDNPELLDRVLKLSGV